jgi:hypothetical protein
MRVVVRRVEASVSAAEALRRARARTTLLFDLEAGARCHRVIDGGSLRQGSTVVLAFTERRADHLVARSGLDLRIGHAVLEDGAAPSPIVGQLAYEITFGRSFDGATFVEEEPLAPTAREGDTIHERAIAIPDDAEKLFLYARIRAFLVASYASFPRVTERRYQDGQRVVLADAHDNPDGAFSNYEIVVRGSS